MINCAIVNMISKLQNKTEKKNKSMYHLAEIK